MDEVQIGTLRHETARVVETVRRERVALLITKEGVPVACLVPATHRGAVDFDAIQRAPDDAGNSSQEDCQLAGRNW